MDKEKSEGQVLADSVREEDLAVEARMRGQLLKDHTRRQAAWEEDGPELTEKDETAKIKRELMIQDMVLIGKKNREAAMNGGKKSKKASKTPEKESA